MLFDAMFLFIFFGLKTNKRSFGFVHGLKNILYSFHLSLCSSVSSIMMRLHRCFELFQ